MRAFLFSLLLFFTPQLAFDQQRMPPKLEQYRMTMIKKPKLRLTKNWAFVVDTSHSMSQDRAEKAHKAFLVATQFPTDELNFCMYTFNDRGVDRFRDWAKASPKEFTAAHNWARKKWQRGVLSYGGAALKKALHQKKQELTIIIISDGGFTEGYQKIKNIIIEGQAWRTKSGFDPAIIACIGVENLYYRTGGKELDHINQQWLHDIGDDNNGGYSYIHKGSRPINPLRSHTKKVIRQTASKKKPKSRKIPLSTPTKKQTSK